MSEPVCTVCRSRLVHYAYDDSITDESFTSDTTIEGNSAGDGRSVCMPDDLQPICNCHFHWECIFEACEDPQVCPSCGTTIVTEGRLPCVVKNEGGIQEDYDILPELQERLWVDEHERDGIAITFLELCRADAVIDMLGLLREEFDKGYYSDVLRFQYPLPSKQGWSALHYAVEGEGENAAWLLLYLASDLELQHFPPVMEQLVQDLPVPRSEVSDKGDIRNLATTAGLTPEDLAVQLGLFTNWLGKGLLSPPA